MALTPALAETGKVVANKLDEVFPPKPREGQAQLQGAGDGQAAAEEEADVHQVGVGGAEHQGRCVLGVWGCGLAPSGGAVEWRRTCTRWG